MAGVGDEVKTSSLCGGSPKVGCSSGTWVALRPGSVYAGNAIFCRLSSFSFFSLQHMLEYKLGFCVWQAFLVVFRRGRVTY